jgi:hypothetical protein
MRIAIVSIKPKKPNLKLPISSTNSTDRHPAQIMNEAISSFIVSPPLIWCEQGNPVYLSWIIQYDFKSTIVTSQLPIEAWHNGMVRLTP